MIKESDNIKTKTIVMAVSLIVVLLVVFVVMAENQSQENTINNATSNIDDEIEEKPSPGFEAVFAIAGLLAIAYLVLRQRD